MKIHQLQVKKQTILKRMKELWAIRDGGKSWDETQSAAYEKDAGELSTLNKEIEQRQAYMEQVKEDLPKEDKSYVKRNSKITLHNVIRSVLFKRTANSAFREDSGKIGEFLAEERSRVGFDGYGSGEVPLPDSVWESKMETRTDVLASNTTGSAAVEKEVFSPFISALYANTWFKELGCTMISNWKGNFSLPGTKASPGPSFKAEGAKLAESSMTLEEKISLQPHKFGDMQIVSNQFLMQSEDPDIVQRELQKSFASKLDEQLLNGNGTAPNVKGVFTYTNSSDSILEKTGAANGTALSYTDILDALSVIKNANQSMDVSAVVNPNIETKAKKTLRFSVNGSKAIWDMNRLADLKTVVSTSVPSKKTKGTAKDVASWMYLLVPSSLWMVQWGLPSLAISTEGSDWFKEDASAIRIQCYLDLGLVRPESDHLIYKDILTA